MTKIAGSGSISQRHGSADPDPDPHQKCHGSRTLAGIVEGQRRTQESGHLQSIYSSLWGILLERENPPPHNVWFASRCTVLPWTTLAKAGGGGGSDSKLASLHLRYCSDRSNGQKYLPLPLPVSTLLSLWVSPAYLGTQLLEFK